MYLKGDIITSDTSIESVSNRHCIILISVTMELTKKLLSDLRPLEKK